jgi:hypothetical protein
MPPAVAARPTARQRFLREAQAAAAIEHDHIVAIHQVGEDRGLPYLAMQFLKGETLQERLDREGRLPISEVIRIGRETAQGLAAAHARGLIHRDIKPANVFLANGGVVKILDFGLARAVADNGQVTQDGIIIGTPAYMAPEQARGQALDARCDLFSLGCMLYRMCTGKQPFQGADAISILMAIATDEPHSPRDLDSSIPSALSDLIVQLLAKEIEGRPCSASAVVEALRAVEDGDRTQIVTPPAGLRNRSHRGRHWRWVAGSAGLIAAAVLLCAAIFHTKTTSGDAKQTKPITPKGSAEQPMAKRSQPEVASTVPPPSAPRPAGPFIADRIGAEWILQHGGQIEVTCIDGGAHVTVASSTQLPAGSFFVSRINLAGKPNIQDAGLENIRGLSRLESLWLHETGVSDAGLVSLKDLKQLRGLNLGQTRVSDRGLEHLQGLGQLECLYLSGTAISDAGLRFLKGLTKLRELHLRWTRVTDAGLENLNGMVQLQELWLQETGVADPGVDQLKGLKSLRTLHLEGTRVSEAGIQRLKGSLAQCAIHK